MSGWAQALGTAEIDADDVTSSNASGPLDTQVGGSPEVLA